MIFEPLLVPAGHDHEIQWNDDWWMFGSNPLFVWIDNTTRLGVGLGNPRDTIEVIHRMVFDPILFNTLVGEDSGASLTSGVRNTLGAYHAGYWLEDSDDNSGWGYKVIGGAGSGGIADYPTLRATTAQADPGLTHTTAIANVTELQAMSSNRAGNYYLTGNIDASATSGWNGGQGFIPIGGIGPGPFTGTFDGDGYTITGLVCNRPASGYQALFGYVTDPATIANVTLASCAISGDTYLGALVGYAREINGGNVKIQNCHSSGTVQSPSAAVTYFVGGLIGNITSDSTGIAYVYDSDSSCTVTNGSPAVSEGFGGLIGIVDIVTISNCFATGNVTGGTVCNGVGGFIGELGTTETGSTITYCYATGNVSGNLNVGGFVGYSSQNDTIQKCSATGNVTISGAGADCGGGFFGRNANADYTDCYAWGDVTCAVANGRVGGFGGIDITVGSGALFTNCYSIGTATGLLNPGGFIELTSGTPIITESFWDTEASGNASSDGGVGHITTWMKTKTNYEAAGWDMDTIWYMEAIPDVHRVTAFGSLANSNAGSGADDGAYLGYKAGEGATTHAKGVFIGAYSGCHQTT